MSKSPRRRPRRAKSSARVDDLLAAALADEQRGRLAAAEATLRRIPDTSDRSAAASVALGRLLCRQQRHDEAIHALQATLTRHPDRSQLWFALANAHYLAGRSEDALDGYRRAARLAPRDGHIPAAMANVYHRQGQLEAAAAALGDAIAMDGADPHLYQNRGYLLMQLGRPGEALAVFRDAALRFDTHAPLWTALGNLLFQTGQTEAAMAALKRAVALAPQDADIGKNLARKLHKAGNSEAAAAVYREVVARHPEDESAAHCLAALTGQRPPAAPLSYVRDGFDRYAERFDRHLVDQLGYATPALLRRELDLATGGPGRFARALDLGCGTGLSGAPFRALCDHLTGVDLSAKMLAKAREKGIYHRICQAEGVAFLDAARTCFDLVIAADVLVYIGDLTALFVAVARRMVAGAHFLFSIEGSQTPSEYTLTPSGRYTHHRSYIQRLATAHGFACCRTSAADLRKERGQWVRGDLFVLKRDASATGK